MWCTYKFSCQRLWGLLLFFLKSSWSQERENEKKNHNKIKKFEKNLSSLASAAAEGNKRKKEK